MYPSQGVGSRLSPPAHMCLYTGLGAASNDTTAVAAASRPSAIGMVAGTLTPQGVIALPPGIMLKFIVC